MDAYQSFAKVYDTFMDNIPYDIWCEYIVELLTEYEITGGLVLELGCGTGNMTKRLSDKGYDMIGVDASAEMLEAATQKQSVSRSQILYLQQDMCEFELYGTVRAVVSICDCVNYILEEEKLLQMFRLVNNYLDPQGVFLFDLNTVYKYEKLMGDATIAENREEGSFIWENYYDKLKKLNVYELTLFIPENQEREGYYRKYEEVHYQRAYTLSEIRELLERAGMEYVAAYDACSHEYPKKESERIYIIARESGKQE